MDEYWICQHCKSLNRAGTSRCYHCRQKFGSGPAQPAPAPAPVRAEQTHAEQTQPAPPPPATKQDLSIGTLPPSYLSRPLSPLPSLTSFTGSAAAAAAAAAAGPPGPITIIKRRVSRTLVKRPTVSVAWLGQLTSILLVSTVVAWIVLVVLLAPVALNLLVHSDPGAAWAQVTPDRQRRIASIAAVVAGLGICGLVSFSLFTGLSTHNATGLGADMPLLTPYCAGVCWARAILRQVEIAIAILTPVVFIWLGYLIPGLIVAIVALEFVVRRQDDLLGWFVAPSHHLPDLYLKMGTEGTMDSITAWLWSACFRAKLH